MRVYETALFLLPAPVKLTLSLCSSTPISIVTREFRRFANIIGGDWHIYVCTDFYDILTQSGRFCGQNRGKKWCDVDPNELVLTFGGCYLLAIFGKNRSRNVTVRVHTDRHTL